MSELGDWLRRAAAKIEPKGAWTQGAYARDASQNVAPETASYAVYWCMEGAIRFTAPPYIFHGNCRTAAEKETGGSTVRNYNDAPGRTQAECVAALRKAAELADKSYA